MADVLRNFRITTLRPSRYQARTSFDATAARDLARLDPAAQPAAQRHIAENHVGSRAVHNLVGRILELSDPGAWQAEGEHATSGEGEASDWVDAPWP